MGELYQQSLQASPSLSLSLSFLPHPTGLCITGCCNVRDPLSLEPEQLLHPANLPLRTLPSLHTCCINVNILLHRFPQRINSPVDAGMPKGPSPSRRTHRSCVPCVECSSVYIGQTGRSLKQRVSEHRRARKNGDVQTSALAEHVFKTGHAVDLGQSEVLDHHQHTTTCCVLESWYIQHNQAVLNKD